MVLVDPFSAASKPMPDWDSIPSRPLPFAATLHALDLNAPPPPRLPRALRSDHEELPEIFPSPPYSHARHASPFANVSHRPDRQFSPSPARQPRGTAGSDEWMESLVANCVDNAKCVLDLSGCRLESVSTNIRDLRDLVTLSNKSPSTTPRKVTPWTPRSPREETPESSPQQRLGDRSFARTQSAPASAAVFSRRNGPNYGGLGMGQRPLLPDAQLGREPAIPEDTSPVGRRFTRSKTGAASFSRTQPNLEVFLGSNELTSLPTALFEIRNLTLLSLRNNQLRALPAAIGELVHLRDLNISHNLMEHLPSTILDLGSLEILTSNYNPWRQPPAANEEGERRAGRILSPLQSFQEGPVPRLSSLCLSILLSPRPPTNLPPFMSYDWDAQRVGGKHPLLDVEGLHREILPEVAVSDLKRIVQAVKSACEAGVGKRRASTRTALIDRFPAPHGVPPPDDASTNMYYSPCPSPKHLEWDAESGDEPLPRVVFLDPAEERIEWREIAGVKGLPVRWLGCSSGCLSFLEEEEEDWPLEGFEGEPTW